MKKGLASLPSIMILIFFKKIMYFVTNSLPVVIVALKVVHVHVCIIVPLSPVLYPFIPSDTQWHRIIFHHFWSTWLSVFSRLASTSMWCVSVGWRWPVLELKVRGVCVWGCETCVCVCVCVCVCGWVWGLEVACPGAKGERCVGGCGCVGTGGGLPGAKGERCVCVWV